MAKCNKTFLVSYSNRKVKQGIEDWKNYKIMSFPVKACNFKQAYQKIMRGKKGYDVQVYQTDRLLKGDVKGKVLGIKYFSDKN